MKILKIIAASAIALGTWGVSEASATITYNLSDPVQSGGIFGTITTDGNTGILGTADLLSWNLTVSNGTTSILLNPGDSHDAVLGPDLTATASQLLFNFSDNTPSYLFFQDPIVGANGPYACFISAGDPNDCFHPDAIVLDPTFGSDGPSNPFVPVQASGPQVIGRVPEPATLALFGAGLFGVGFMMRARRRKYVAVTD